MGISVVLSGGAMGEDPLDPRSWSGSSARLCRALADRGMLHAAFGARLPAWRFAALALPRFHPDREIWRRQVFRDLHYRRALTSAFAASRGERDFGEGVLQLGAYLGGRKAYGGAPYSTYQDGCAYTYAESPYADRRFAPERAGQRRLFAFERETALGARKVFTTSKWLADRMVAAYRLPPEKVVSVGIGTDIPISVRRGEKDYGTKDILFVGVEFERKGGKVLLEAFGALRSAHPDAVLHIVGPSSLPYRDDPRVVRHGFIDRTTPDGAAVFADLLRTSSVFVLPSLYEPFGLSAVEALANGLPAIVSGGGALAESVRPEIDGLHVPPGDVAALTVALDRLLSTPDLRRRLGEAAFGTPARITWGDVAERILREMGAGA